VSSWGSPTDHPRVEWSLDIGARSPRLRSAEVDGEHDLQQILDGIERDAPEPVVAELVAAGGARLGIGLGGPRSVLAFNPSSEPPYFMSVGNAGSADQDAIFYLHGHWTEFPMTALVPKAAAREAALQFMRTGDRPDNVVWEEV
jgi:Immunity protein Imm1